LQPSFVVIFTGSAVHKKLTEVISRPRLLVAIKKLSNYHQTSGLEAKHSLDNLFASKNVYYPYHSLMERYVDNCNIVLQLYTILFVSESLFHTV
jgi:hypothetical protein